MAKGLRDLIDPVIALPRPMRALFLVQVVNRMGDFVTPFLALYLTRALGMGEEAAGVIVTATFVASILGTLAAGRISDLLGRKPVLVASLGISAALIGLCGFLPRGLHVAWILVAASFFQGSVRPVISALIADLCPQAQRKDAYAFSYFGINLGCAVGPMIAGFLFESNLPWLFWADALSTAAAIALACAAIPAVKPKPEGEGEAVQGGSALKAFLSRPALVAFCLLLLVANFMYSQMHFALPLATSAAFGAEGPARFGGVMSLNAIVVVAFTPLAMRLTRGKRGLPAMALGSLLYAAGFGFLALPLSLPLLYSTTLLWTLGEVMFSIFVGAHLSSHSPANLRGRFQAYRETFASMGRITSPYAAGLLIAGAGLSSVWILVGGLGIAMAGGFALLSRAERGEGKKG